MLPRLRLLTFVSLGTLLSAAALGCGDEPAERSGKPSSEGDEDDGHDGDPEDGSNAPSGGGGAGPSGQSDSGKDVGANGDAAVPSSDAGRVDNTENPDKSASGTAYGEWTYYEVDGALCRDGSPAGYYIRKGTSKNLMIFLNGGGVCYDDWFCSINPSNPNTSLPGETLLAAVGDIVVQGLLPIRQQPTDSGIFKNDPENPVGDWTQIYVPYCTGDVHAGTREDAPVPRAPALPPQQFVGYRNIGLFLEHFGKPFKGTAEKVLLTGSSAGGFGSLLNFDRTQDFFGDDTRVFAITDSGIPFTDPYMEACLQKEWRELWGLNDALPKSCKGCFDPAGGGLAQGLGDYIFREKYAGRGVIGGGISSKQDEIIKLFFSAGLNGCTVNGADEAVPAALGLGQYPAERYPTGLRDFLDNVAGREKAGSYIMEGTQHQHIFRDRYYDVNGLGTTLADWVGEILDGKPTHLGTL